jgi:hypothetical protein
MWKLKAQPANLAESQLPGTFTDATATRVIETTQEQIHEFQEKAKREIATALRQVPGEFPKETLES